MKNLESAKKGFIPSAQRELVEGGEVSEGISGERSDLRNVVDGSSSDVGMVMVRVIKDYRSHRRVPETESRV